MPLAPDPNTSEPGDWIGTHIRFKFDGPSASGKTNLWTVMTNDGYLLGHIKWFGRWRKYSFFPEPDCVFEQMCLREIAEFIEVRSKEQRTGVYDV